MYSFPTLWKKMFFLWRTHQKYAIKDFCFLQALQGSSSWGLSLYIYMHVHVNAYVFICVCIHVGFIYTYI